MSVDYEDERFAQVESQKGEALNQVNDTYNSMINGAETYYNELKQAASDYGAKQQELQQAQTDQTIKEINQQKEQAEKDYTKEQKASYADYAKQTNAYGVNSEKMASAGFTGSGYSESSKVSMYNSYQNRYAVARETYNQAVMNYNNQIAQAQIANSIALAEIAYNSLKTQLEYSLQGFQYKNSLLTEKLNATQAVDNNYYNRYQDVVNQINTENSLAEQIRQYNTSLAEDQRQYNESMAFDKDKFAYQKEQDNIANNQWQQTFDYQKQRDSVSDSQWQKEYELSVKKANASSSSSSKIGGNIEGNNEIDELFKKYNGQVWTLSNGHEMVQATKDGKTYTYDITSIADKSDEEKDTYIINWLKNLK